MFDSGSIKGLPSSSCFAVDREKTLLKDFVKFDGSREINLPVVMVTDKNGNILFISMGYRIGIGEQILKYIR
jgi:hypothetical protein